MKYLDKKGLSLSQAQSVSNIINQKAIEIENEINMYNNYSETIKVEGEEYTLSSANHIPDDIYAKINYLGKLRASQAFLMEAIKEKDRLLIENRIRNFKGTELPEKPELPPRVEIIDEVGEDWGWEQLSANERSEFLYNEAMASHIGKFIHKGGKLDKLRAELPTIPSIRWRRVEDGKDTPIKIHLHHNSQDLLNLYEGFASLHRKYESRVNYFKAKVKNLVNTENTRINSLNVINIEKREAIVRELQEKFQEQLRSVNVENSAKFTKFQKDILEKEKEIAALRIKVNPLFSEVIDGILKEVEHE